jgi:hypothetical protein
MVVHISQVMWESAPLLVLVLCLGCFPVNSTLTKSILLTPILCLPSSPRISLRPEYIGKSLMRQRPTLTYLLLRLASGASGWLGTSFPVASSILVSSCHSFNMWPRHGQDLPQRHLQQAGRILPHRRHALRHRPPPAHELDRPGLGHQGSGVSGLLGADLVRFA